MTEIFSNYINSELLTLILVILNLVLIIWLIKTEIRLKKLFAGKDSKNLESLMNNLVAEINSLQKSKTETEKYLENIEKRLKRSIQGLETIRFKPFKDFGGNQSFASAFLNEEGNGLIISSMYAREHLSIFAKPIKNYKSEYEMTDEEKEVLSRAKGLVNPKS